MEKMIERILLFCDHLGMSISAFASSIGVNQVTLNNYKLGKRKPSLDLVDKVAKTYPQVSAEWLLRGVGQMCCSPSSDIDTLYNIQQGDNNQNTQVLGSDDTLKDEKIKLLEQKIEFLQEQVEFYKNK